MEHSLGNEALRQWYAERGFGGRVGFGERPAVLVIDVAPAWVDPAYLIGSRQEGVIASIVRVLECVRERGFPVFFTTMAFRPDGRDAGEVVASKWPLIASLVEGTPATELHPALERRDDEVFIVKQRSSAFFGTSLLSQLVALGVDTTVVVGLSTSGCIRSTCEEAFNNNFRVIVPREAIGDRCESAHEASLFDIDNRFGDVMPVEEALAGLAACAPPLAAVRG